MSKTDFHTLNSKIKFNDFKHKVLNDYKLAVLSRECSLLGRKEVLTGKAKFGVFGDGKELPQVVLNHFFKVFWWIFISLLSPNLKLFTIFIFF